MSDIVIWCILLIVGFLVGGGLAVYWYEINELKEEYNRGIREGIRQEMERICKLAEQATKDLLDEVKKANGNK